MMCWVENVCNIVVVHFRGSMLSGFDIEACFILHTLVSGDTGGEKRNSSSSAGFYTHISRVLNPDD